MANSTQMPGSLMGSIGGDASKHHQPENKLERYRLLFEHSRDILLFVRVEDGRILEANQAAEKAYGFSREELLQRTILDLRLPEERYLVHDQLEQANSSGLLFETTHQRKDGTAFPVEVSTLGADFGEERVNLSIIRDIHERRQAENERAWLAAENQRQQALLDAIFEADPSGLAVVAGDDLRFQYANPAYRLICQHPKPDLVGRTYREVWPVENSRLEGRIRQVLKSGRPFITPGVEQVFPDCTRCVFTIQARRVQWGDRAAVLLIYWDTTYLSHTEQALSESEARYRTTLLSLGDAVIITDCQGNVIFINPAAERLTGWPEEEAGGQPLESIFSIVDKTTLQQVTNPVRAVLETGSAASMANHSALISRDARVIPIENSAAAIKDASGATIGAVMVFHDLMEKREEK